MSKRRNKKMILYRDVINVRGSKYSVAELIGTVALLAAWVVACLRVAQTFNLF